MSEEGEASRCSVGSEDRTGGPAGARESKWRSKGSMLDTEVLEGGHVLGNDQVLSPAMEVSG